MHPIGQLSVFVGYVTFEFQI